MSPRKLNPSEKAIETVILLYLNHLPECFAWKNNSVGVFDSKKGTYRKSKGQYNINGVSDVLGIYRGRMLAVEVKRKHNSPRTTEQEDFINHIIKHGGIAGFCHSIECVQQLLKEAG